jgi:hypothetical protein
MVGEIMGEFPYWEGAEGPRLLWWVRSLVVVRGVADDCLLVPVDYPGFYGGVAMAAAFGAVVGESWVDPTKLDVTTLGGDQAEVCSGEGHGGKAPLTRLWLSNILVHIVLCFI